MSTSEVKIPLARAKNIADRFMKYLEPHVSVMSIAGSVRREVPMVGDIEVVIVPKDEFSIGVAFPLGFKGLTTNGSRLKKFYYPESNLHMELYITNLADYGRMLAIRTGSSFYSHTALAMQWNRAGWAGSENGLRRKVECDHKGKIWRIKPEYKANPTLPPKFDCEMAFYNFLGVPWIEPRERSWVDTKGEYNYKL